VSVWGAFMQLKHETEVVIVFSSLLFHIYIGNLLESPIHSPISTASCQYYILYI